MGKWKELLQITLKFFLYVSCNKATFSLYQIMGFRITVIKDLNTVTSKVQNFKRVFTLLRVINFYYKLLSQREFNISSTIKRQILKVIFLLSVRI